LQPHNALSSANFRSYPFSAIVGHSTAKLALMLLAVDNNLRGVLLSSASGTAKTALSRAARVIFQNHNRKKSPVPFFELPLSVTVDRLLGGLDFEQSLLAGRKLFAKGLLAEAHGGVLLIDDINLLDISLLTHIAAALDTKTVPVESDDLKLATGADFVLLGVYNSETRKVSSLLRERVGLIVESDSINLIEEHAEIVSRVLAYQENPVGFINSYKTENCVVLSTIETAKARLPLVKISLEDLRHLSFVSMSLGVEGNQADIFAARVAKANAALCGRDFVNEADMITAIQLVLLPRATQIPTRDEVERLANQEQLKNHNQDDNQSFEPQNPERQENPDNNRQEFDSDEKRNNQQQKFDIGSIEDLIIKATDAQLPKDVLQSQIKKGQVTKHSSSGKWAETSDSGRGRYVRNSARKSHSDKIAIAATLRAAAPFQLSRRKEITASHLVVKIASDDLRYKRFRKKSGILYIFAVDASGSMALNRMAQAKGAMTRLLQDAYIHRDKVSLISFRNVTAETLLPPTRSIELAKRIVDAIPTGGATPVAAALLKALEIAGLSRSAEISQALLIMFTDGRANVGLQVKQSAERKVRNEIIKNELHQLGSTLQLANIATLVMDTKVKFMAGGEARELAETIGANYCYVPRADDKTIYQSVSNVAKSLRNLQ
jgi:magnesium chelatase subunit D